MPSFLLSALLQFHSSGKPWHDWIQLSTLYLYLTLLERITIRQNNNTINWWLPTPIYQCAWYICQIQWPLLFFLLVNLRTRIPPAHTFFFFPWNTLNLPLTSGASWILCFLLSLILASSLWFDIYVFYFFQLLWALLSSRLPLFSMTV